MIFILGLVFQNETGAAIVGHHRRYWFYWFRVGCWFIKQFITASYRVLLKVGSGFTVADIGWPAVGAAAWVAPLPH